MGYERKETSGTASGHATETTRSSPTRAQTEPSGRLLNSPALPPRTRSGLIPIQTGREQSPKERHRPPPGTFDEPRGGASRLRVTCRRAAGRFGTIDFYLWRRSHNDKGTVLQRVVAPFECKISLVCHVIRYLTNCREEEILGSTV
ncbi:unnamed protein product [Angiostrongylus costaricensis]|uniref:Uncharacterized protein n=1 Tax=Angiostrongylus costaricensis TaxID=334426 RepID=A0A0R3PIN7_ANGCS|nr:unnamed protein product [Angiostrongylus costaricensis]